MEQVSKIQQYENLVLKVLQGHSYPLKHGLEKIVVADREAHHYQLLTTGWIRSEEFIHHLLIHFHIKPNGKIWLLCNETDLQPAQELVYLGVPKEDIVLGFHSETMRPYTEYAVS